MLKASAVAVACVALSLASSASLAADEPAKGKWVAINKTVEVLQKTKDGTVANVANPISTVAIDRTTGDMYAFINASGLWKSTDAGKTFTLVYDCPKGSCGSSFSLYMDNSDGKRLVVLLLGGPSAATVDGGKTWQPLNQEGRFLSVDWSDAKLQTIAARVGGHSTWNITMDGGKTWKAFSKGKEWSWLVGVFDPKTFICTSKTVERTEDGGATWTTTTLTDVSEATMTVLKGNAYIITKAGLGVSKDKGKTWETIAVPKETAFGPYFGKDENHMIVGTHDAFYESKDAAKKWDKVMDFPFPSKDVPTQGDHGGVGTAGYDAAHDIFYYCSGGKGVQAYRR